MLRFLFQPYPVNHQLQRTLVVCGAIGLFVALFLAVFTPFGMHRLPAQLQWKHALIFGATSFVCSAVVRWGLPLLLPRIFDERRWQSWKEILFLMAVMLAVAAGNFWLMQILYGDNDNYSSFLSVVLMTIQVGLFPVVVLVMLTQMRMYRQFAAAAAEIKTPASFETASPKEISITSEQQLTLRGDGQKEALTCTLHQLLFMESSDNYVRIHYLNNKQPASVLFRSSLKKIEEQLAGYEQYLRCHRMYIVNLEQVVEVSGNAQGLRLHLAETETPVPVSRSLSATIKNRLQAPSHSPQTA